MYELPSGDEVTLKIDHNRGGTREAHGFGGAQDSRPCDRQNPRQSASEGRSFAPTCDLNFERGSLRRGEMTRSPNATSAVFHQASDSGYSWVRGQDAANYSGKHASGNPSNRKAMRLSKAGAGPASDPLNLNAARRRGFAESAPDKSSQCADSKATRQQNGAWATARAANLCV